LDNIYVTTKQYTMYKIKLNKQLQTIKLNNKLYLPFLIHNLPNNYNKFNISNIIKIGTTIYINSEEFTTKFINNYINTINFSNLNNNNIK
jgi:ribosome biogenesis protein Tsr3